MPTIKQERDKLARQIERLAAREEKAREAGAKRLEKLRAKQARETVRLCQRHGREVEALCKKLGLSAATPACGPGLGCRVRLRFKSFEGWSGRLGSGSPVHMKDADPNGRIAKAYNAYRKIPRPEDFDIKRWFTVSDDGEILEG